MEIYEIKNQKIILKLAISYMIWGIDKLPGPLTSFKDCCFVVITSRQCETNVSVPISAKQTKSEHIKLFRQTMK